MVNKCASFDCKAKYESQKNTQRADEDTKLATFHFPNVTKRPELHRKWVRFVNRSEWKPTSNSVLCEKHFEKHFISRGKEKSTLKWSLNPVPTIYTGDTYLKRPSVLPIPESTPRKKPTQRGVYADEINDFNKMDMINSFEDFGEEDAPTGFLTKKDHECIIYYRLEFDTETKFPRIFESIKIDSELHVQLQYNSIKVPLPDWFVVGKEAKLNRKSMISNFPPYLKNIAEERNSDEGSMSILDELEQRKHYKPKGRPPYSAALIRYALLLRYTSAQAYTILLQQFPLPSFSLLRKIQQGGVDSIKALKLLREKGKISEDLVLMADEMYLQKATDFSGGEYIGADDEGTLYKGVVAFMVVGIKQSIPYVVKATPEVTIKGSWLCDEIDGCISLLAENGFRVRAVVTDNHSTNVRAFAKLREKYNATSDHSIIHPKNHDKNIYLFYDNVHLLKNIRNNLLNNKKFVFPAFDFCIGSHHVSSADGYISWKDLHNLHEKDMSLDANLRKAPRINHKVLHPGNNKQDVNLALSIFHETTIAAFISLIPDRRDCSSFLELVNTWWLIVNSKSRFHVNSLGNAVVPGDGKIDFLNKFADWLEKWHTSPHFTLTPHTFSALVVTLRGQAMLLHDLLIEGYEFVMTTRFQSDPLERRFSQYRQMSGGRFLVSLREVINSERILACRALIKQNVNFWEEDLAVEKTVLSENFMEYLQENSNDISAASISEDSSEVATTIAGYIAKKLRKRSKCDECKSALISDSAEYVRNNSYLEILSRGGLTSPSQALADFTCNSFAALDFTCEAIEMQNEPARSLAEYVLINYCHSELFTCHSHQDWGYKFASRIVANVFFNNKRKLTTANVRKDQVTSFKTRQRSK